MHSFKRKIKITRVAKESLETPKATEIDDVHADFRLLLHRGRFPRKTHIRSQKLRDKWALKFTSPLPAAQPVFKWTFGMCPEDVKKTMFKHAKELFWTRWAERHEVDDLMEGILIKPVKAVMKLGRRRMLPMLENCGTHWSLDEKTNCMRCVDVAMKQERKAPIIPL